jgi:hypothetical protein
MGVLVLLAACAVVVSASSGLRVQSFNNSAFAYTPLSDRVERDVDFEHGYAVGYSCALSIRVTGGVRPPVADLLTFEIETDGSFVLLWVGDHLLISNSSGAGLREVRAAYNVSLLATSFAALRLEVVRGGRCSDEGVLRLFWWGNHTAKGIVPSSALSPWLSVAQEEREALERLVDLVESSLLVSSTPPFLPTPERCINLQAGIRIM